MNKILNIEPLAKRRSVAYSTIFSVFFVSMIGFSSVHACSPSCAITRGYNTGNAPASTCIANYANSYAQQYNCSNVTISANGGSSCVVNSPGFYTCNSANTSQKNCGTSMVSSTGTAKPSGTCIQSFSNNSCTTINSNKSTMSNGSCPVAVSKPICTNGQTVSCTSSCASYTCTLQLSCQTTNISSGSSALTACSLNPAASNICGGTAPSGASVSTYSCTQNNSAATCSQYKCS